jgi:hypothetical protein
MDTTHSAADEKGSVAAAVAHDKDHASASSWCVILPGHTIYAREWSLIFLNSTLYYTFLLGIMSHRKIGSHPFLTFFSFFSSSLSLSMYCTVHLLSFDTLLGEL